jgi:exodeoxyribonuclease VII large subunit
MSDGAPVKIAEITSLIKEILEGSFPSITLEGEMSNVRPSSTGHLYFTLKDETSAISAVMFKGKSRYLPFEPKDGLLVHATGSISVYEARGTYQIIVDSMKLAGAGDILRLLEERKRRLASEGLFDQARKRPIPACPASIAAITSPTGAAVHDILQIVRRRNKGVNVTVLPASVQGADAASSLVRQIEAANRYALGDVIIIGRGGGALEDLLPFSDEALVRAVAASGIPVVSAVGHEIDWSLCDFAADLRAPTPSAAAELVVPESSDLAARISRAAETLVDSMKERTSRIRLMMAAFDPESLELRFRRIEQPILLRFDDAKEALLESLSDRVRDARHRITVLTGQLEGANPRSILKRGYAMVRDAETGAILRSASDTAGGKLIEIIPERGRIVARVEEARDEKRTDEEI